MTSVDSRAHVARPGGHPTGKRASPNYEGEARDYTCQLTTRLHAQVWAIARAEHRTFRKQISYILERYAEQFLEEHPRVAERLAADLAEGGPMWVATPAGGAELAPGDNVAAG